MKSVTLTAQWSLISYVKNFSYTGASQSFTAPYTGYYSVQLWGAQGGIGSQISGKTSGPYGAGYGAYTSGQIKITKANNFYIYIGQQGVSTNNTGAWNGGGLKGTEVPDGSGGGATDIRAISGAWNNAEGLRSRIIVSGGGGGSDDCNNHSPAGGTPGGLSAYSHNSSAWSIGTGYFSPPTQTSGGQCNPNGISGSFGMANQTSVTSHAGGGGGWYGGSSCDIHSMGGSSYISGHTGSVAVTSTSSSSPKSGCTTGTTNNACSITPYINPATNAGYTFSNTVMIDGAGYKWTNTKGALTVMPNPSGGTYASGVGHSGNGYARITWLGDRI